MGNTRTADTISAKVEEIQNVLQTQLESLLKANRALKVKIETEKTRGVITEFADGVARVAGLSNVKVGETVTLIDSSIRAKQEEGEDEPEIFGVVVDLDEEDIGCIVFGEERFVKEGDKVELGERRFVKQGDSFVIEELPYTRGSLSIPVGEKMLGRVLDPFCRPLDRPEDSPEEELRLPLERKAIGVIYREKITESLHTGVKAVDAMLPIGRGQRMLIIGDRSTGKTTIALDTIIHQNQLNHELNRDTPDFHQHHKDTVYCIYVAIGRKASEVDQIMNSLRNTKYKDSRGQEHHCMQYTTIIAAMANDPASLLFVAPFAGCTLGEYFRDLGRHALVIYDDLTRHAAAYRQISLLLRRPPGREAFPGDIFYLHSRLLERACKVSKDKVEKELLSGKLSSELKKLYEPYFESNQRHQLRGGGSLTAIPIVETKQSDYSAYIPTNIISITDGQIYLEPRLFNEGVRPAINVGISVSRVGMDAQTAPMKEVSGNLRVDLANYREKEKYTKFGFVDKETQFVLERGRRLVQLFKQGPYRPMNVDEQVANIFLGTNGYLDMLPNNERRIHEFAKRFWEKLEPKLKRELGANSKLSDTTKDRLHDSAEQAQIAYLRESIPVLNTVFENGNLLVYWKELPPMERVKAKSDFMEILVSEIPDYDKISRQEITDEVKGKIKKAIEEYRIGRRRLLRVLQAYIESDGKGDIAELQRFRRFNLDQMKTDFVEEFEKEEGAMIEELSQAPMREEKRQRIESMIRDFIAQCKRSMQAEHQK